jgi:hypothetical protein
MILDWTCGKCGRNGTAVVSENHDDDFAERVRLSHDSYGRRPYKCDGRAAGIVISERAPREVGDDRL